MPQKKVTLSPRTKRLLCVYDVNRIKILLALYQASEFQNGSDLVKLTNIHKSLVSYHVCELKKLGLINEIREGKFKKYKIEKCCEIKVKKILQALEVKL